MPKRKSTANVVSKQTSKQTEADAFNGSMQEALARIGTSPENSGQVNLSYSRILPHAFENAQEGLVLIGMQRTPDRHEILLTTKLVVMPK